MAEETTDPKPDFEKNIQQLQNDVNALYKFRDMFFENHPVEMASEKTKLLKVKVAEMSEKFNLIDELEVPLNLRAKYLYIKGRCYNSIPEYDPRALECFSKAVKLNPNMIDAWNELGESYWKNLNIKESRACLEGSLKRQRHRVTLRSLSILLRQSDVANTQETRENVLRSVEYAKEAVSMDIKDGLSWSVLGNAYLCQFFSVEQLPGTLKLAMSAYKQAWNDAIARGTPDLPFNKGITANYEEDYALALECFAMAHRLEPSWRTPVTQMNRVADYLRYVDDIVHAKGRVKTKRLQQMVKSMEPKLYGQYAPGQSYTLNKRKVTLQRALIADLEEGANENKVVLGRVVGSYHSDNNVPFTFAIIDESMSCVAVNVYNWADGRGVIIGDAVCIPEPAVAHHVQKDMFPDAVEMSEFVNGNAKSPQPNRMYNFKAVRVNNPLHMLINGKRPSRSQYAGTMVTTSLEACSRGARSSRLYWWDVED